MFDDDRLRLADRLRDWLDASPAELVGLAVLVTGAALLTGIVWWTGTPRPAADTPALTAVVAGPAEPAEVVVHVSGAVHRPGIVRLRDGSRIVDALDAAGGPRPDAALDGLNLARPVSDGEQVRVPTEEEAEQASSGGASGAWTHDGRLDLNRATQSDLEELPGVGPVLAGRIVAWRDANGPFTSVGQLREVSGIGEATLRRLADLVTV